MNLRVFANADAVIGAQDDVVENIDAECATSLFQTSSHGKVGATWSRVTGRVIVNDDD